MHLLPGIFEAKQKNGTVYYRSSITYKNKHISLGSFSKPDLAHNSYIEAKMILLDSAHTLLDYDDSHQLSFDKWVSLINFRDNHVYIKTPIYLYPKYFLYYLTPSIDLKFDIDDLFYYSSHKISKRQGHLFVADYGMQVGILSRYGIKSHAVESRDYRFINGDKTDFRYENIEIINKYYGVLKIIKKGATTYQAHIHIRGNYILGTYSTEEKAAVAYNKAIDLAKKAGVPKNYTPNYVETLSAFQYADTYMKISLSQRFLDYLKQN